MRTGDAAEQARQYHGNLRRYQAEHVEKAKKLVAEGFVHVKVLKSSQFYIECTATDGKDTVHTITEDEHDNLVSAKRTAKCCWIKE